MNLVCLNSSTLIRFNKYQTLQKYDEYITKMNAAFLMDAFLLLKKLLQKYLTTTSQICPNLASLVKWLSVHLRAKWLWVRVPLQSLKLQIWRLF